MHNLTVYVMFTHTWSDSSSDQLCLAVRTSGWHRKLGLLGFLITHCSQHGRLPHARLLPGLATLGKGIAMGSAL